MTTWTTRSAPQTDLWYLLTELSDILTEEEWKRIIFHNWEFYNGNTLWYSREEDEWNTNPQTDLWYLLTELSDILTEEEWKRIIFHNWKFYN